MSDAGRLRSLEALVACADPRALATVVSVTGGGVEPGARMWLDAAGQAHGALAAGGCLERDALEVMRVVAGEGSGRTVELSLAPDDALLVGGACDAMVRVLVEPLGSAAAVLGPVREALAAVERGERVALAAPLPTGGARRLVVPDDTHGADVFVETLAPLPVLVIVGATPLAVELVAMSRRLGFRALVVDPREAMLARPGLEAADARLGAPAGEAVASLASRRPAAVIAVAHDAKFDVPALAAALRADVPYVAMLGSRKRAAEVRELLAGEGVDPAAVARLRAPAGLAIGARGAPEIALSILGELVQSRAPRRP